jgi:hypothetical protein
MVVKSIGYLDFVVISGTIRFWIHWLEKRLDAIGLRILKGHDDVFGELIDQFHSLEA